MTTRKESNDQIREQVRIARGRGSNTTGRTSDEINEVFRETGHAAQSEGHRAINDALRNDPNSVTVIVDRTPAHHKAMNAWLHQARHRGEWTESYNELLEPTDRDIEDARLRIKHRDSRGGYVPPYARKDRE